MAAFTQQRLEWRACDEAFLGKELSGEQKSAFEPLGQRVQCASMRAPLDYADPAGGELQLALSRVMASQPQQRQGAIFFNPGGPGGDGLPLAAWFAAQGSKSDTDSPGSEQLKQMSDRYDLIGFSPRGVGAATLLDCGAPAGRSIYSYWKYDDSPENVQGLENAYRLQGQACSANPLSQHIHTDAIARDMDLMRVLLGEEKLHYIGYSYGTELGFWYANLFPERVGRMLLDSISNVFGNGDDIYEAREKLLEEVVLPYATRHSLKFNLGQSVDALFTEHEPLGPKLWELLFSKVHDEGRPVGFNWSHSQSIDSSLVYVNAALGLQTLMAQQPAADEGQIRAAIATHPFSPDTEINGRAGMYAQQFAAELFKAPDYSKKFSAMDTVLYTVRCNDRRILANALYLSGVPETEESLVMGVCANWPKQNIQPPSWGNAQAAEPILMLQSRYDAVTPLKGAQATLEALPNASMIVVENEFQHSVFPYGDQCVDAQVVNYFLHGTMPPRQSSCAGKPLRLDMANAG